MYAMTQPLSRTQLRTLVYWTVNTCGIHSLLTCVDIIALTQPSHDLEHPSQQHPTGSATSPPSGVRFLLVIS